MSEIYGLPHKDVAKQFDLSFEMHPCCNSGLDRVFILSFLI